MDMFWCEQSLIKRVRQWVESSIGKKTMKTTALLPGTGVLCKSHCSNYSPERSACVVGAKKLYRYEDGNETCDKVA